MELYLLFMHKEPVCCICIWFLAEIHADLGYHFQCSPVLQKSLISVLYACFNIYRWMLKACVKYPFSFFVSSGSYQTGHNSQKLRFLYCTPPSVLITYSPEGLWMLLRFWWWFLNSLLVEYMNIVLPSQVFYCCEIGYWKPCFFISSFNSWCYFIFWKLFLNPAGILEGRKKWHHLPFFFAVVKKGNGK